MKSKAIAVIMTMLFLVSITAIATPVRASPSEVWVPSPAYPTIQAGIDAVAEYGTVRVLPGTYYEHVVITKPLTLAGLFPRRAIIDGGGTGNVIHISNTHHVSIKGFTVRNGEFGIFISWTNYFLIEDCDAYGNMEGWGIGINAYFSSHGIIKRCNAYSNNWWGIAGGSTYINENLTITHCNAYSNTHGGIILGYYLHSTIEYCNTYSNGGAGIDIDSAQHCIIKNCKINNNAHGISLWGPAPQYNTITENVIVSNTGHGIVLGGYYPCYNTITKNTIDSNNWGIVLGGWTYATQYNMITDNMISNNFYGVHIEGTGPAYSGNEIYHNKFIKNKNQALDNSGNIWDNSYPSGGNYWSDYVGVDLYHGPDQNILGPDGIGDTPYSIPGSAGSEDRYPLIVPFQLFRFFSI